MFLIFNRIHALQYERTDTYEKKQKETKRNKRKQKETKKNKKNKQKTNTEYTNLKTEIWDYFLLRKKLRLT